MVKLLKKSERGVALLATLMAIALMTILVVDFTSSSALGYRSAANQANELHAEYLARSAVNVGLALLAQQARMNEATQTPFYALNQPWAMPFPPVPMDGGTATVSIVDEARKLNINQLINPRTGAVNPDIEQILERLFASLEVDPRIIPAIVDWLDPDSVESPGGGAEADYYMQLIPPYEPRNGPMPTIGDLRMVRGVNTPIFMLLRQFLTAAPESRVNANTVSPELLASLSPELASDTSLVKEIVEARTREPFTNITDISNLPGVGENSTGLMQLLTTTSSYFTITGVGTYAGARRFVYATFRSNPNGTAILAGWNEE
ncbi:MAG TPA: type II secretion system minor pseudopilin GspK [Candidatus Binataceae bacterium]|nr:type II secretion system minor pseudopilin GspK [Candidatus Binataceae bacterium]